MRLNAVLFASLVSASSVVSAVGFLETPNEGSIQTGIGVISGFLCQASAIQVSIDGNVVGNAGYGTPRADTEPVCGIGNIATGFSLLYNFNLLEKGTHSVAVIADGIAFGRATFKTTNLGGEYLSGLVGKYSLLNFPSIGTSTSVEWNENNQNFSITGASPMTASIYEGARVNGNYYGATGGLYDHCDLPASTLTNPKYGRFAINFDGNQLRVDFNYVDGTTCFLAGTATLESNGYVAVAKPSGSCATDSSAWLKVDGLRLKGQFGDSNCYHSSVFAAKSTSTGE